jgi:hypothetical protein
VINPLSMEVDSTLRVIITVESTALVDIDVDIDVGGMTKAKSAS